MRKFIKALYKRMPYKHFFFNQMRGLPIPDFMMRHLRFDGVIDVPVLPGRSFLINNHSTYIENDLFWLGYGRGWEATSLKLWRELASVSKYIFDVGANTGVYSLAAKCINPTSVVVAIEPADAVFQKLRSNIELNHYEIIAEKFALSDQSGSASLYDVESEHSYVSSLERSSFNDVSEVQEIELRSSRVECLRMDHYVSIAGYPSIDLVKIDIEGHEPAALRGFGQLISRDNPAFLIEILTDEIAQGVMEIVSAIGYDIYRIDEEQGITKETTLRGHEGQHRNFLLCTKSTFAGAHLSRFLVA